jgi:DNA-binding NarL/FixJ family response regulator
VTREETRRTRVLIAKLEPIARLGLSQALVEDRIEVLGDEQDEDAVVLTARQTRPDAIVLGDDQSRSAELAARLRVAVPEARLVFFHRDGDGPDGMASSDASPPRSRAPFAEVLLAELAAARPNPEE